MQIILDVMVDNTWQRSWNIGIAGLDPQSAARRRLHQGLSAALINPPEVLILWFKADSIDRLIALTSTISLHFSVRDSARL